MVSIWTQWTETLIAAGTAFLLTLVIGKFLIPELRKLKAGQEIRADGPTWHASKAGTPTMGGIMFIIGAGVAVFVLGWPRMLEGDFAHLYVYLFALCFGLIGFVDDYRKVRQHQNEGLTAKQKFVLQLLAAVVSFLCAYRRIPCFRFDRQALVPDRELIGQCMRLGLPIAAQNALIALSCMVLQAVVNGFGEKVVTANTAVAKIEQLVMQPYNSLSSALSAFTGQNMGAGKKERVSRGFRTGLVFIGGVSLLMLLVMQFFGRNILSVFVKDGDVIEIGMNALRITSFFYIFLGLIYVVRGILNGAGDKVYSGMNGIVELCCRIGLAAPLTRIPAIGMWGCFLCSGLTWMITGLLSLRRYLGGKWQKA